MGPLKHVEINAVARRFDFSRRTGTSLDKTGGYGQNGKKRQFIQPMNLDDSTLKRSVQQSVTRRRATSPAEKHTGGLLQNNYPSDLISKFTWSATLLTSELGGLTVGYGSDPPPRPT